MLRNYTVIAIRNILNQKFFSILNILGLAAGLATFLFIYVYVESEEFYDQDWENAESIYRINQHVDFGKGTDYFALSSYPLANSLNQHFSEVKHAIRVTQYFRRPVRIDTSFHEVERIIFADREFFDVFDFEFVEGLPSQALSSDNSVVLSNEVAQKLFPETTAVGKKISFSGEEFMIRGVYNTYRKKSHIRPDMIASFDHISRKKKNKDWDDSWMRLWVYTYVELKAAEQIESFNRNFGLWQDSAMYLWKNKVELNYDISFQASPVTELHFDHLHTYSLSKPADQYYFRILSLVAFLVLLIASVNFVNLGTARSVKRAKEVGIRKVCGATRSQLVFQFLSESIIITAFASVIALVLVEFSLPFLNAFFGTDLSLFHFLMYEERKAFIAVIFTLVVGVGTFSGVFPAFILSSFEPVVVLKIGGLTSRRFFRKNTLSVQVRKFLVISQFVVATALVSVTVVIFQQIRFLKTVDMGFDKEKVLVLDLPMEKSIEQKQIDSFLEQLKASPFVKKVEHGTGLPGYTHGRITFYVEDKDSILHIPVNFSFVGSDYLELLGLELESGRFFHPDSSKDEKTTFVINESAKALFGDDPIGRRMKCGLDVDGEIIGVIKDFHYRSLKGTIQPMVFVYNPKEKRRFALKLTEGKQDEAVDLIAALWHDHFPDYLLHYAFLAEEFNKQYKEEDRLFALLWFTAFMALFIALLGLFGLSTFVIEQQSKNIGIKKALGASVSRLVFSLMREFAIWVMLANVLAWPIAYVLASSWLSTFAYHVRMDYSWFAEVSLVIFVFACLTVSYQAVIAASRPPTTALKYE